MAALVPLKSKRVPISLAALSTALRTSTRSGSQTVSKRAWAPLHAKNRMRQLSHVHRAQRPLQPLNSFGIAARRPHGACAATDDVRAVLADAELAAQDRFVLGGGSNIVLTGDVGRGAQGRGGWPSRARQTARHTIVEAGAGENWHDFVGWTLQQGLPGLENLALIPGTVGASPVQNIGAYGVELQDRFHELDAIDLASGEVFTLNAAQCGFGYRDSVFKHAPAQPGDFGLAGRMR